MKRFRPETPEQTQARLDREACQAFRYSRSTHSQRRDNEARDLQDAVTPSSSSTSAKPTH